MSFKPHAMIKGTDVQYPNTQVKHDKLKALGYSHRTSGHWMFKKGEDPVFVTSKAQHDRLKADHYTNSVKMVTPSGGDFFIVMDLGTYRRKLKEGLKPQYISNDVDSSSDNDECSESSSDMDGSTDCEDESSKGGFASSGHVV